MGGWNDLGAAGRKPLISIPDPMVAAIFSAILLSGVFSPWWAKASDKHGRKPLMIGLRLHDVDDRLRLVVPRASTDDAMMIFVFFLFARSSLFCLFGATFAIAPRPIWPATWERTQAMSACPAPSG